MNAMKKMMKKKTSLGVLVLLAAPLALAGEPARTVLFENEKVRVAEIAFAPGDAEAEHTHTADLVVIALSPGGIESVGPDGSSGIMTPKAGDVAFLPKGSTHRARNAGKERVVLRVVFLK